MEPYGYSETARNTWIQKGWTYVESNWQEVICSVWPQVDAIIVRLARYVGKPELDRFPDLKLLVSATTGLDHLDIQLLNERGIRVVSLRGHDEFLRTIPSTAEHTWALMMSLMRFVPQAVADVSKGHWRRDSFRGRQMKGKTLGIVGMGRTGRRVAEYASAFGMTVRFYDPFVPHLGGFTKDETIEALLSQSDIVSIHVHLLPETRDLLNKDNINHIKEGALLINTSRGAVWNEQDVVTALAEGRIGGVAADVLSEELGGINRSPLVRAMREGHRVIITPHIGGATWDAMWECEEFLVREVI